MSDPVPATLDAASVETPEGRATNALPPAVLLAAAGGSLDAFLYLAHGHVFAGAMTGNAVLCGVAVLTGRPIEAVRHALPLVAFFCGVWLAELLQEALSEHAVSVGLACEAGGLLLCSFLPASFPDLVFIPLIPVLAAYQVASFRKADIYSYNSTFITGNLRTAIVGLYAALHPDQRQRGLRQARELGLIVLSFLAGAAAGALLAPWAGNSALRLPAAILLVVLGMALLTQRPAARAAETEPAQEVGTR